MNDQEPIPDPILLLQPDAVISCALCRQPVNGERFVIPSTKNRDRPYVTACPDCYAAYVKAKFGSGNPNPDDIVIV